MGHGHADVDLERELGKNFPPPYCEGPWKPSLGIFAFLAVAVLGVSIRMSFLPADPLVARAGPMETPPTATPYTAATMGAPAAAVTVAGIMSGGGEGAAANVRQIRRVERTAFNTAARAIRPSVVGVRATLSNGAPGRPKIERIGSGVVVDAAGHIVTCNHVVAGTTMVAVSRFRTPDNPLPATIVAAQEDLALLKVADAAGLPPATLADSENVQVGDWVLAVGQPFGLGLTVTAGIVGRRRGDLDVPGGGRYTGLLQTDAPINEGSSGGPLVNLDGEVVGLNTAIYAPTGVFSGAGFAIPSNRVRQFLGAYVPAFQSQPRTRPGRPMRGSGWWGVGLADLTPEVAARLSFPRSMGVVVQNVEPNSPAAAAQILAGDVILAIGGRSVTDLVSARDIATQLDPSGDVPLQIWRRGQTSTTTLRRTATMTQGGANTWLNTRG